MATDRAKTNSYTGGGIAVGIAIGVALGAAFNQVALGLAIGTAIGASMDVFSNLKRKKDISADSGTDVNRLGNNSQSAP